MESKKAEPRMMLNSASLAAATVITSALGLIFWAVSARMFDPAGVGLANAQLSGATLLASICSLNLGAVMLLYLPRAGKYTRWIVRRCYILILVLATAAGVLFLAVGLGENYLPDATSAIAFVVAVPMLALFMEQDAGLLALGAGPVVAVENISFAVGKIVMLPIAAALGLASGIFVSWIVPVTIAVAAVSIYLFRRLIPAHMESTESIALPPRRALWKLASKSYFSFVSSSMTNLAIPLVVTMKLGTTANGYLTIAWLVGVSFGALILNFTQSFNQDVRKGHAITMKALKRLGALLFVLTVVGSSVVVVAAPLILEIMAPGYAEHATGVLRLVALSAPFQAIWLTFSSFLWLENRIGWIAIGNTFVAVIAVGLTWVLSPTMGIAAAGLGCLIGFGLAGIVSVIPLSIRVRHVHRGHGADWAGEGLNRPDFTAAFDGS